MGIIKKDGREFYRFKIGDEFKAISGKGSFNKMKKQGLCSDIYDEKNGFVYPVYSASSKDNHVCGYSKEENNMGTWVRGPFIKTTVSGDPGKSIFFKGDRALMCEKSYALKGDFANEYTAHYLNYKIPSFAQGSAQKNAYFPNYSKEYMEVPTNHQELSKIIKRINEYKQLSKQLSKQLKDYKKSIIQESDKRIKEWRKIGQHDKYFSFKIGDEFKAISGKGSFNKMKKEGLCSDVYDEKNGFVYPVYSASSKDNHICGYSKKENNIGTWVRGPFIKTTVSGDPGKSIFFKGKRALMCEKSYALMSNLANEYVANYFNYKIPSFAQGSAQKNAYFPNYSDNKVNMPIAHMEISKKIEQIQKWETTINKTTKQMERYIDGVLQLSLGKGDKNEKLK